MKPRKPAGTDLYVIQMAVTGAFKVGRSNDIDRRLGELQVGCPHRLKVLIRGEGLGHLERHVQRALRSFQTRYANGEWFHEEGLGSLPVDIYDLIPEDVLEDPDWWKRT